MTHWDKGHPDDGTLQAWLDRDRSGIDADEAGSIGRHAAECAACAARLAEMRDVDDRAREILRAAGPADTTPPDFDAVLIRARKHVPGSPARRRWINLAWAASLVGALGLGWLTSDLVRRERLALDPTVEAEAPAGEAATERAEVGETDAGATAAPAASEESAPAQGRLAAEERRVGGRAEAEGQAPTERGRTDQAPPQLASSPALADPSAPVGTGQGEDTGVVVIRGRIVDDDTGAPLAGVQVHVRGSDHGALSHEDGTYAFSVTQPQDRDSAAAASLIAELIGYRTTLRPITAGADDTVSADFRLQPEAVALGEVVVEAERAPLTPPAPEPERRMRVAPVRDLERRRADSVVAARARAERESALGARTPVRASDIVTDQAGWTPVSRAQAESRAGFTLLTIPGLDVVAIEVGVIEGAPVVRLRQALGPTATLTLIEGLGPTAALGRVRLDGQPAFTTRRNDLRVTATAPVAPDSLVALVERLR